MVPENLKLLSEVRTLETITDFHKVSKWPPLLPL